MHVEIKNVLVLDILKFSFFFPRGSSNYGNMGQVSKKDEK